MAYSQNNEEKIILDYFNGSTGNFCDIGANDGITLSNTRALAERGWKGVLIEPSPRAFEKLKTLYHKHKGFYIYQVALGNYNGNAILFESGSFINSHDVGMVSTFKQNQMDRFKKVVEYVPTEVKIYKWRTFLNRLTLKEFDMISMDIEGNELEVLPDIDLSKTKLICIEFNGDQQLKSEYEKYLAGFKLIYTSPENLIYVK